MTGQGHPLDHKYLNELGAFKAWGIGLHYEYDESSAILDIVNARGARPILYIDTNHIHQDMVLDYAYMLERVSQLYALNVSNKQTIDITETLNHDRLRPILAQTSKTALRALHLKNKKFRSFNHHINTDFVDYNLLVKKIKQTQYSDGFYSACLKTKFGVTVPRIQEIHLHKALSSLSAEISNTLIADQMIRASEANLNASLRIATELSLLSAALDPNLKPAHALSSKAYSAAAQKTF